MDKIIIRGGQRLSGKVRVHGAKNAVLPIIAASILAENGESTIYEVPGLDDVYTISEVIRALNVDIKYDAQTEMLRVDASQLSSTEAPYDWVRKMRASFLVMGPLLARKGASRIPLPGGCAIGSRGIDQHLKGFEAMGAKIEFGQGYIDAKVDGRLKGARIYLDIPSVGATENIMMAASMAEGTTIIENVAQEPEIVDLANYLNAMGAHVRGAGTGTIRIEGVESLTGATHYVIPDRIEAGTYMIAAAITRGDMFIENAIGDHLKPVIAKLREMGVIVEEEDNGIHVYVESDTDLKAVDIKTLPHPGFPTDMQAQFMALLLSIKGTSLITETVFENRFMHVDEFKRMGAKIKIEGRTAIVEGGQRLTGAQVRCTDLRAGAALLLTGLICEETSSELTDLHHIDRGYVDIVEQLKEVGADLERQNTPVVQLVQDEEKVMSAVNVDIQTSLA